MPSYTPLPVIAALWGHLPLQPDRRGNARLLLKKFLWRSFLTSRYEHATTAGALRDYRALKKVFQGIAHENDVPIFDTDTYVLPTEEIVLNADWPSRKSILGRGILALQIKCGAEDLADGSPASVATITSKQQPREYHHLFPASTL